MNYAYTLKFDDNYYITGIHKNGYIFLARHDNPEIIPVYNSFWQLDEDEDYNDDGVYVDFSLNSDDEYYELLKIDDVTMGRYYEGNSIPFHFKPADKHHKLLIQM